jgi:two-component system, OmpR family, sensor kinase
MLRTRLLVITAGLAAAALAVAGGATYVGLRAFLLDQVDDELSETVRPVLVLLYTPDPLGPGHDSPIGIPAGTVIEVRDPAGETVIGRPIVAWVEGSPTPDLPDLPADLGLDEQSTRWLTVDGYRVLALADPEHNASLVLAMPLDDVEQTLKRLLAVELAVSGLALLGIVILGSGAVRVGLAPLRRIQRTAEAIAAGDLSRRVEEPDAHTEVGQLAGAFDVMVARLEAALAERAASEDRLRRFVSDASHELRTPLTSIRGYAELFRRGAANDPEGLTLAMRRIEEEALRMGGLVDDLLLLARLDEGRPLERTPVDLAALAADAVADFGVAAPEHPVTLDVDGPVVVLGDEPRLRQVLVNLLANVREHTPAGTEASVRVSIVDGRATLVVADRGPGFSPEEAARVFQRFHRVDASRARTSGGSGLGLSIVDAIVRSHGGAVSVDAAPGRGAAFAVVLPIAPAVPDALPVAPVADAAWLPPSATAPDAVRTLDGSPNTSHPVAP